MFQEKGYIMRTKEKLFITLITIMAVFLTGCLGFLNPQSSEFDIIPISDITTHIGNQVKFTVKINNPDELDVVLSAEGTLAENFDVETGEFSWIPSNEDIGDHQLVISAGAGKTTVTEEVIIKVIDGMFFLKDFSTWELALGEENNIEKHFEWDNKDGIYFGVYERNNHGHPDKWWVSYSYASTQVVESIKFTYTSTFNDAGNEGRCVLEIYDLADEPRLLDTITVPYDNEEGIVYELKDMAAVGGIELRYQRKNNQVYEGYKLNITDLELLF